MRQRHHALYAHPQNPLFLAQHGLAGKTVEQIVDTIDQTPQSRLLPHVRLPVLPSSKLSDGEQIYTYIRRQILSLFAPYEWRTHPVLTRDCQGENAE